jgi:hypothetical protein
VSSRSTGNRVGRPPRYISVEVVRGLYNQGYSFRTIACWTGIGYGTVRRAFHGLAPRGADTGGDLSQASELISRMPAGRSEESIRSRSAAAGG